jgi:hypothetical protein
MAYGTFLHLREAIVMSKSLLINDGKFVPHPGLSIVKVGHDSD